MFCTCETPGPLLPCHSYRRPFKALLNVSKGIRNEVLQLVYRENELVSIGNCALVLYQLDRLWTDCLPFLRNLALKIGWTPPHLYDLDWPWDRIFERFARHCDKEKLCLKMLCSDWDPEYGTRRVTKFNPGGATGVVMSFIKRFHASAKKYGFKRVATVYALHDVAEERQWRFVTLAGLEAKIASAP